MPSHDKPPTAAANLAPSDNPPSPEEALPAEELPDVAGDPLHDLREAIELPRGAWDRRTVSVPRRFGMGTLLILITCYALWFQVGRVFDLHPAVIAGVAVYFFVLGLVQWFVGEGQRVRRASAWTGVVMVWGGCLVVIVATIAQGLRGSVAVTAAPCMFAATFPVGIFLGYAGGTLVAGVFLLMRLADEAIERWRRR